MKDQTKAIETELMIILADYSNDLHAIKKRDGKLPGNAAVDRINHIINKGKVSELERIVKWHSYGAVPKHIIDDRIKALKGDSDD